MKNRRLKILSFTFVLMLSASICFAGIDPLTRVIASAVSQQAETLSTQAPADLSALQSADDAQFDEWAKLPSFDGRDYDIITPARNQANKNLCWSYAAIGAIEANILRKGIDPEADKSNLNFDEVVTAYARYNRDGTNDPLGLTANDTYSNDGNWNVGGNTLEAFAIATQGYALTNDAFLGIYDKADKIKPLMGQSKYYVKSYVRIENNPDAIKHAILKYGAVAFNYNNPKYRYEKYYDGIQNIGHSSLIVGWDDTINKNDFRPAKPNENGAWIVKNSWGNYGNSNDGVSCFYLSYESFMNDHIYAADMAMREDYQNIYYYDGKLTDKTSNVTPQAQGAIYKAQRTTETMREKLSAVMIGVRGKTDVYVKIYRNLTVNPQNLNDTKNKPDQNSPVAELNVRLDGLGMHTIDLKEPIKLKKDEYFSVVVTCRENGKLVSVVCAEDDSSSTNDMTYYLSNGKWTCFKKNNMSARIRAITNVAPRAEGDVDDDQDVPGQGDTDEKRNITSIDVLKLDQTTFVYSGSAFAPEVIAEDGGKELKKGEDFEVEYQNNTSAGEAKAIVKGKNDYTGEKELTFTIERADRQNFAVSLSGWTYEAEPPTPVIEGMGEDAKITYTYSASKDGDYSATQPTNAGTYWIKAEIEASANFNAAVATASFTIEKAEHPAQMPDASATVSRRAETVRSVELPDGWEWENPDTVIDKDTITAAAVYFDRDNYKTSRVEITLTKESPKDVTVLSVQLDSDTFVYDGTSKTPNVVAEDGTVTLEAGKDFEVEYQNNKFAGEGKAIVTFKNDYKGTAELSFTISKASKPNVETIIRLKESVKKLSDVQLPSGFVWEDGGVKITSGKMTAKAVYVGEDAENFVTKELTFEIISEEQSEQESLIWLAAVIPAAVLLIAGAAFAIVRIRRKKNN